MHRIRIRLCSLRVGPPAKKVRKFTPRAADCRRTRKSIQLKKLARRRSIRSARMMSKIIPSMKRCGRKYLGCGETRPEDSYTANALGLRPVDQVGEILVAVSSRRKLL